MERERTEIRGDLPAYQAWISRVVNSGILVAILQLKLTLGLRCPNCLTPAPQHLRGSQVHTDKYQSSE